MVIARSQLLLVIQSFVMFFYNLRILPRRAFCIYQLSLGLKSKKIKLRNKNQT